MLGILLLLVYVALGIVLGEKLFPDEVPLKRWWLGGIMGMMLLCWSNVPFSFIFGFGKLSHLFGLLLSAGTVAAVWFLKKDKSGRKPEPKLSFFKKYSYELKKTVTTSDRLMLISILLLMVITIITLWNHTLQYIDGAYYTGQCTYGDMNMHLGFITSIANQGTFPPDYNILPGTSLNYPFLCDSISSSLYLFGTSLKLSYIAPMIVAFILVFQGVWYLCEAILKSKGKTVLAFFLFILDGGFGFIYFLDGNKTDSTNFTRIFTAFYETPTNLVDENVRWTNVLVDMLIPQRATLFGWMCLFGVLYVLYRAVFDEDKGEYYLLAGIMGGLLPMIHTHSYFALGLIAIGWIIVTAIRDKFSKKFFLNWVKFGIPALAISIPQLIIWTFNAVGGNDSFVRFVFNWSNSEASDWYLWFWIKNLGLVALLLPTAFLHAEKKMKQMYVGPLVIFVIAEFLVFQPNLYDNIKLFFVWYLFTAILAANLLCDCYEKLKEIKGRRIIAGITLFVLLISGTLTLVREVYSGVYNETTKNAYQLYNQANTEAAEWINENTEADSVFLCWNNHNNAIAALTGRNIYVGAGTFLYYHGVNYSDRQTLMKQMFADSDIFEANKSTEEITIDYVYIGDYERSNITDIDETYFQENYECVYSANGINIYDVRSKLTK